MDSNKTNSSRNAIYLLLGAVLTFRIAYILIAPFDLIHDEAYYWDWSRNLDWCYYSKPPGIAWLIALSTAIGGSTAFFVRLPAAILSVAGAWFGYCLAARLYDRRVGFVTAMLILLSPGNAATGVVMSIDAPFLCCWSASLYCFWRMLERDTDRVRWAILTTLAVGTGLLFKQTMLAFPALAGTFVMVHAEDRKEWQRASFWLVGLGALAFLAPMIWWNSQHDWITFTHTREHFEGGTLTWLRRLATCGEFLASQAGLISPVTYVSMAFAALLCCQQWQRLRRKELFLLWFWLGPVMATLVLSLTQRVEANWPAPFYATAFVAFAAIVLGRTNVAWPSWNSMDNSADDSVDDLDNDLASKLADTLANRTIRRCLVVGAFCVALVYALPFGLVAANAKGSPIDMVVRMWGWRDLATEVDRRLISRTTERHQSEPHPKEPYQSMAADDMNWLVAMDRAVASELAFYLPHQPRVFLWDENGRVDSQYDVWGMPLSELEKRDTILVCRENPPPEMKAAFSELVDLGVVEVRINTTRSHRVHLWRGREFVRVGALGANRTAGTDTSRINR